jgi:EAL domain-containing protein (putative c-di-GMP-specific phosphodiesterase class I)
MAKSLASKRCSNEKHEQIFPAEFFPIGDWVLRKACYHLVKWKAVGMPQIPRAVNLSALKFKLTGRLDAILK